MKYYVIDANKLARQLAVSAQRLCVPIDLNEPRPVLAFSFGRELVLGYREAVTQLYLHAGGPGIHAGVEDGDKHSAAVIFGEPGEKRRGAGFFLGEQPVEGERFLVRMRGHDSRSDNDDNKAGLEREQHGVRGRGGEELDKKGGRSGYPVLPPISVIFITRFPSLKIAARVAHPFSPRDARNNVAPSLRPQFICFAAVCLNCTSRKYLMLCIHIKKTRQAKTT